MTNARKILVADDNRDVADLLSDFIGSLGLEVHTCYDGMQARSAIAALRPQVVMLDVSMPGLNGCELAHWIRHQEGGDAVRLIALTGYTASEEHEMIAKAGFDTLLIKPLDLDGLERVLAADLHT